ncbi:IucA/IucC family protein [Bacillus sp. FJAT-27245]|uniref:IucA/IucC family protein n=1 Tax=Bacillus sp. FJAT-27245 TaxID=1684144 RepID=UPI0006A77784|nr:IucA/IucC family protein [Bacillus sp. FJAT-27245]
MLSVENLSIHTKNSYQEAEKHIIKDLLDAFLLENLFSISENGRIVQGPVDFLSLEEGESLFEVPLSENESIVFPVRFSVLQSYRLSGEHVYLLLKERNKLHVLNSLETARLLIDAFGKVNGYSEDNLNHFLSELTLALIQTAMAYKAAKLFQDNQIESFIATEQLAALRDRPFHPTSKAKEGWTEEEYRLYSPEFQQPFKLSWLAVRRDYIRIGKAANEAVFNDLLTEHEKDRLTEAFEKEGISRKDYFAMPVHPWQKTNVIAELYQEEINQKICIPIDVQTGSFTATSSLRSLVPVNEYAGAYHLKLPIGISSLGALRLMPTRYLLNGEKGQSLLEQAKDKDRYLKNRLFICDERNWWAFQGEDQDLFADKPGHLTCQIRSYPSEFVSGCEYTLVSMAALAVGKEEHLFSQWLGMQDKEVTQENVTNLFDVLCSEFTRFASRFLLYGIMPELHGQNVVAVIKDGSLIGFLLRDHDTVRIYPEWMERANLEDPDYIIRKDTPNTLINRTPEDFLSYFQTLAVEVNLYAIIDSLCAVYHLEEAVLWKMVKESIWRAIHDQDFDVKQRNVIYNILFLKETWPMKRLLDPLLRRNGSGGGSMPSSIGEINNPFYQSEKMMK